MANFSILIGFRRSLSHKIGITFFIECVFRSADEDVVRFLFIKLDFIDGDFLYKQINAGRMKLKHETDELYDTFLITASTYELQQFIQKYGNDDRFFDKENSVTLIRKS